MPLIKSKSKHAFEKNVETEMNSGKPQDQSLAIAYNVKKKSKKKKMAEGGMAYKNDSARTESRPSTAERDNDKETVSKNSGNKPSKNDSWTDNSTVKQAQKLSVTPLSRPKMVGSDAFSVRSRDMRDDEADMMDRLPPETDRAQPPQRDNEDGPNRQGPKVSDMASEHATKKAPYNKAIEDQYAQDMADAEMKKAQSYAKGGIVEQADYSAAPNKYEDDLTDLTPSEDEGASNARSRNELDADSQNPNALDMEREHSNGRKPYASGGTVESGSSTMNYADGGSVEEEEAIEHAASIAAAIMAKRKMMALGGEILEDGGDIHSHGSMDSDDSDQVDLSRNADEDANEEDQASFDALRKENYSETAGLDALDSPEDSNEHGDDREDASENTNSRNISDAIRRKMRAKSAITRQPRVKIDTLKDLQKLIQLCQKTGVEAIKIDGIEMAIKPLSTVKRAARRLKTQAVTTDGTQDVSDLVDMPDELTPEQLLFYSAQGHVNQQDEQ